MDTIANQPPANQGAAVDVSSGPLLDHLNAATANERATHVRTLDISKTPRMVKALHQIWAKANEGAEDTLIDIGIGQTTQTLAMQRELEARGFRVSGWTKNSSLVEVSWSNNKVTQMTEPHGVSTPQKDNRSSCV